jgi:dolichol-phosphate mannosyltransferase
MNSFNAVSVIIPAFEEPEAIVPVLERILRAVHSELEVLVVVDSEADSTIPVVRDFSARDNRVRCVVSNYGNGPAQAIRFGFDNASHPITVVTMADGSDDPAQIDLLARLVERGVVIASASRYSSGGQQVGGPMLKGILSRSAGKSLGWFARVGTFDATNSFKAYSTEFVREVGIDSRSGFEIGLELTAKARRLRRPVAELPTIWLDRTIGDSAFRMRDWIPKYLRWYGFAFGPALNIEQLRISAKRIAAHNSEGLSGDG